MYVFIYKSCLLPKSPHSVLDHFNSKAIVVVHTELMTKPVFFTGMTGATKQSGKTQAPCYSMTGRSKIGGFSEDLKKTPGPGAYNTTEPSTYKEKRPSYSMTSRNTMPGDATIKPGPGAHSPERVGFLRLSNKLSLKNTVSLFQINKIIA